MPSGPTAFSGNATIMQMMKRNPELVPVAVVCAAGCVGAAYYVGRLASGSGVVWSGRQEMPWTRVTQGTNLHFTAFSKGVPGNNVENDLRGKL